MEDAEYKKLKKQLDRIEADIKVLKEMMMLHSSLIGFQMVKSILGSFKIPKMPQKRR